MKHILIALLMMVFALPAHAAGVDSNTVLMMHMDGASFTDDRSSPKTISANGNAVTSDTQFKWEKSGEFDGSGDNLTTPDSNDFAFGTGGATIDFWVYFSSVGNAMFFSQSDGSNAVYLQYYHPNTTLNFQIYTGASLTTMLAPTWTPIADTWYHVALVKNGTDYAAYVDGVKLGNSSGGSWPNVASLVRIGGNSDGTRTLDGYIDEYRVSKTARWTAAFTPPTEAYSEPPPPEPIDLGDVKNQYFADKAALLDPDSQVYLRNSFSFTVPEGETCYIFNAWKTFVNGSSYEFYHRRIGVEDAMPITAGTVIVGTTSSLLWYSCPYLVQDDERYEDAETLYYTRLAILKTLPTYVLHVGRAENTLSGGTGTFPATFDRAVIVQNFTHGGAFTVLEGGSGSSGNRSRITNLDVEINDGHEFRSSLNSLQPFRRDMFDSVFLGAGNRSDTYGLPHFEKTSGGVAYLILPETF